MTKKTISAEDSDLFRQAIGKIHPLNSDKIPIKPNDLPKPVPKPRPASLNERLSPAANTDIAPVGLEDPLSFSTEGLQKNVLKKLRQGYFGLDAELDLHGLTSSAAKQQLLQFLHDCIKHGCRCVHIVHGKGYRSAENLPILKNNLNLWLRQHKDVQAFCSAPQKDGGTGAVFVLLYAKAK